MADWLDEQLGSLCKDLQSQIGENPFLNFMQKEEFLKMLEDCASKAAKEPNKQPGDSVVLFKQHMQSVSDRYRAKTGLPLDYA